MVSLRRTVRFCINPPGAPSTPAYNTFAAFPTMHGLGRFYELEVTCHGQIDPSTGYFLNIKAIDHAVRKCCVPHIAVACTERPTADPAQVLAEIIADLNLELSGSVRSLRWRLTPYYSVDMHTASPQLALLRQQFDFAASHRLHVPSLSDEENRKLFGKCTNPSGHGHNYRIEPCVEIRVGSNPPFTLSELEHLTAEHVIERFDHTHLNVDTREFASPAGLNPSVENIAKVCFELLSAPIARHPSGAKLRSVTVWETDKTCCTYPAGNE